MVFKFKRPKSNILLGSLLSVAAFFHSNLMAATTQSLVIFGGKTSEANQTTDYCTKNCGYLAEDGYNNPSVISNVKPISQVESESGLTAEWTPAFYSGWHPWGFVCADGNFPVSPGECTNTWLNYRTNNLSEQIVGSNPALFPSFRYRVRFYVPTFPVDQNNSAMNASMTVKMKVDNWGKVWMNGQEIPTVIWANEPASVDGSVQFQTAVKPGLNTIELVVGDGGGLAGFTYLIQLSMLADGPLAIVPAAILDSDNDGVPDSLDQCPQTVIGAKVDAMGCSYDQRVAKYLESICPANGSYKNHGAYVECVEKAAKKGVSLGIILKKDFDNIVKAAAQSKIGNNVKKEKEKEKEDDDE